MTVYSVKIADSHCRKVNLAKTSFRSGLEVDIYDKVEHSWSDIHKNTL